MDESLFTQSIFSRPRDKSSNETPPQPPKNPLEAMQELVDREMQEVGSPRPLLTHRPLKRRQREFLALDHSFLKFKHNRPAVSAQSVAPTPAPAAKRKRRPLWTDLFQPQKDGDLVLYEQYARHVRSFFADWARYVDSGGRRPHRLLIISGPTGSGKTSTVQVLARKYGFRLLELDTNPDFGRDLENATCTARESTGQVPPHIAANYTRKGTRPYFTDANDNIVWDSRPACVHLECSDGLSGADAHRFIRQVSHTAWKAQRPMVLVCNNRFGPVPIDLRGRPFSREAVFRRPNAPDLRKHVLRQADVHNLSSLASARAVLDQCIHVCQADIRATLTALQFSFVNSASRDNNNATALNLFNDKKRAPDLEALSDLDLLKLHDRVFEYSLDTDVCWDMKKIEEIGEWNCLTDFLRSEDEYLRASILKYRQLFKSGKLLEYKPAHNDYDTISKVRDTVLHIHNDSNLEIYRGFSKQGIQLELLPLIGSMSDLGRSPKQESLDKLAQLLHAMGVQSMGKNEAGVVVTRPDISVLHEVQLPFALVPIFESLSAENQPVKQTSKPHQAAKINREAKNWLKPTETQIQASKPLRPGVWLDFKISDENQAKRSVGLRDLFA